MPELRLAGCRTQPLLGYLKALGALRLVGAQADREARGRWRDGAFELRSTLGPGDLLAFLLDDYVPTPVISPWNGGSGFHPKDRKDAIHWIERSSDDRFGAYRDSIVAARDVLGRREIADKPAADQKLPLVRELRRRLPDAALAWLDAAIVVTGDRVAYPPLFGSGGNDGRYDFSNNFMQAVVWCLATDDRERSTEELAAALEGGSVPLQRKLSLAHLSRDSSPTNSPAGEADSLGNGWDLVLAVEGSLLLAAGAARRHGAASGGALVAPFTARPTAAGYGSAVGGESGRAELWLPLWSRWASEREISALARESRAQVGRGRGRRLAVSGLDFARAAGELGVARGIDAFERYVLLERAGQSTLAVPAGRIAVAPRRSADALRSIDGWLHRVTMLTRADGCPRSLLFAGRRLEEAAFKLASSGSTGDACGLLEAMGAAELALSRSAASLEQSVRPLRGTKAPVWAAAADDGSPEFRVAFALASLHDRDRRLPKLRDYLHGTRRDATGETAFDRGRRHLASGGDTIGLLAAVHARRHLDAAGSHGRRSDGRPHALPFDLGAGCDIESARMFAASRLDEARVLRLLHGLVMLDHRALNSPTSTTAGELAIVPAFDVLALAWNGRRLRPAPAARDEGVKLAELGPRGGWAALLAAGRLAPVIRQALVRLRLAGLPPHLRAADLLAGCPDGPRLAAALLVPLRAGALRSLATMHTAQPITHEREEISA